MKPGVLLLLTLVVFVVVLTCLSDAQRTERRNTRRNSRAGSRAGSRTANRNSNRNTNRNNNAGRRRTASRTAAGTRTNRRPANRRGTSGRRPHASCEEITVPMCKNLVRYTHTKLPNQFNHTTQQQVYSVLEHKWAHMDHSCSKNTRLMLCAMYLPKCHGPRPGLGPCKRTCNAARRRCRNPLQQALGVDWDETFNCDELPARRCLRPVREKRCPHRHPTCVQNSVFPICANLTFTYGTLPNMFNQCDVDEINTEIGYYTSLRQTNCHEHLDFLLCGVYAPFCIRAEQPFSFPCRELCEEVRAQCEPHFRRLNNNLPWPNKLQCHRYPSADSDEFYTCVGPNEGTIYNGGK